MIKIVIPGKPIAKKRPRFARRGKFVTTYSDQETDEGRFILLARNQLNGCEPLSGPLVLCATFNMPIPKGMTKTKQREAADGILPHIKKPDLDNLIKFSKDCLNGIAYKDDSQICLYGNGTGKRYSDMPRTEIMIYTWDEYHLQHGNDIHLELKEHNDESKNNR